MKHKKVIRFEQLNLSDSSKLIGGFSMAFDIECQQDTIKKVNNCSGGNFKAGCGSKNVKKKPKPNTALNANCKGNCVPGCGSKK